MSRFLSSTVDGNPNIVEVSIRTILAQKRDALVILEGWGIAEKLRFRENSCIRIYSFVEDAECGIPAKVNKVFASHLDLGEA